jgi:hypothetical protein
MTTKRFEVRWKVNGNVDNKSFDEKAPALAAAAETSKAHGAAQVGEISTGDDGTDVLLHAWTYTDGDLSNEEAFNMESKQKTKKARAIAKGTAPSTGTKAKKAKAVNSKKGSAAIEKKTAVRVAKTGKPTKAMAKAEKAAAKAAAAKGAKAAAKKSYMPKVLSSHPVLAAFKAREETNRAKLLLFLSKNLNKKVALTKVEQAVYGSVNGGLGKLKMVILGATKSIKKDRLNYAIEITKEGKEGYIALRTA